MRNVQPPKKRKKSFWHLAHLPWDKAVIVLAFFIVVYFLTLPISTTVFRVNEGDVWNKENLYAPFDFLLLKSPEVYKKEQKELLEQIPEVFYLQEDLLEDIKKRHDTLLTEIVPDSLHEILKTSRKIILQIIKSPIVNKPKYEIISKVVSIRKDAMSEVILNKDKVLDQEEAINRYEAELKKRGVDSYYVTLMRSKAEEFIIPFYIYDKFTTELARKQVKILLSPYEKVIKAGTLILANGEKITKEHVRLINSLNQELKRRKIKLSLSFYFGHFIIISLIVLVSYYYFRLNRKRFFSKDKNLILIFSIISLVLFTAYLLGYISQFITTDLEFNIYWAVPVIIATILSTVFFDEKVGFYVNITMALLVSIKSYYDFNLFFVFGTTGSIVTLIMRELKQRRQFLITIFYIFIAYIIAYLGVELVKGVSLLKINTTNLFLIVLNSTLTFIAYPLIYLFERLFGVSSALTFLEYQNISHPLLRELSEKAPGTYQHSLQVANISELCAQKLGYNSSLIKAGALFHDIGKIKNPQYFTENQSSDENPHDKLPPEESAKIIIDHVIYGEELAKKHRLPKELIDFIKTHHGTSIVRVFYEKQKQLTPEVIELYEKSFRYPGPKPQTKEQALLMIVDSVEAASRSLKSQNIEDYENLVDNIIRGKLRENQLDDSSMTFRELNIIRSTLKRILKNIYHKRTAYPKPSEDEAK